RRDGDGRGLLVAAGGVLRAGEGSDEVGVVLLVTALVHGGVVGEAILAARVLLGAALRGLVRLSALQLVAGSHDVEADAAVRVRSVAVERVAPAHDLHAGLAVPLALVTARRVALDRVAGAVDEDAVQRIAVEAPVAGDRVAGPVDLDAVAAVALDVADPHGV